MPKDMNKLLIKQIQKQLLELYPVQDAVQHEVEQVAPMEMEREDTKLQVGICMAKWWLKEHRPGLHIQRTGGMTRAMPTSRNIDENDDDDEDVAGSHRDEGYLDAIWNRRR